MKIGEQNMLYPNIGLQKDVAIFPVFTVNKVIKKYVNTVLQEDVAIFQDLIIYI